MACLTLDESPSRGNAFLVNRSEYPHSYDDVVKSVARLTRKHDGRGNPMFVVRHPKGSRYVPTLYSKPGVKLVSPELQAHEVECGWLYVAYAPHFSYWDWRWTEEEKQHYGIHKRSTFMFDRRMQYRGAWVHFEHDRGSRSPDKLREQIQAYVDFSKRFPDLRFHVVYTLTYAREGRVFEPQYISDKIEERAALLMDEFDRVRRGRQFAVTRYDRIVRDPMKAVPVFDPLGAHFATPVDEGLLTLDQLTAVPNA